MASTLKIADALVVGGKYKVKADFNAEDDSQLSLSLGQILLLQQQTEDRGWVWAQVTNPGVAKREGYVPRNFLEKIPEGDWDQWAYGCEIVSCFYAMFSGMFILLYGSATKTDPTMELVLGTFSMMLASLLMIIIFFRNSIAAMYRAIYLGFTAVILFVGYPMGIWGGITLFCATAVELMVWYTNDDPYTPANVSISGLCRSIFGASIFNMLAFALWVTSNVAIFIWGREMGKEDARGWSDLEQERPYDIPEDAWGFAAGMGTCICFQITCLLIFALQGFQQIILACTNFDTARQGKMAKFKKSLQSALGRESMLAVHKFISFTMLFCGAFHVLGVFSAYEDSGPQKDFRLFFGDGPIVTGGLLIILLAVVLSSTYISAERLPTTFRYVHLTSVLFIGLLVLHGRDYFAPNFYKWLIGPFILFLIDKAFRFGIFSFEKADGGDGGSYEQQ